MKKLLLFAFSAIICQFIAAQDITMRLWPAGKMPNWKKSDDKEKWDSADVIRISRVQDPDIAIYLPTKRLATGQAIVICPGGGYSILAYNLEGSDPARMLAAKGIAAIVLKYRLPDRPSNINPTLSPLMDAQRAIRMVRYYSEKWNIKKDRIGIMGFSAGGHLASTAGTHFDNGNASSTDSIEKQSSRPDFMVLGYPVISMSKPVMHVGSRNRLIGGNPDSTALSTYYSSELQVTDQTPPTFLVHAMDDRTVPVENSLMFYQALTDHKIPSEIHVFPKGGHGFGLALGTSNEKWMDLCIDWIKSLLPAKQ